MATIRARRQADGSTRYSAIVRILKGKAVFRVADLDQLTALKSEGALKIAVLECARHTVNLRLRRASRCSNPLPG
jgi:hypothetical protein